MPLMCDECKCSTYYNEDTDLYSCENNCPCCNDPDYISDTDKLIKLIEYIKIHKISLEQDSEELQEQLDSVVIDSDDFDELNIEDISINGQIISLGHILRYVEEELDMPLTKGV